MSFEFNEDRIERLENTVLTLAGWHMELLGIVKKLCSDNVSACETIIAQNEDVLAVKRFLTDQPNLGTAASRQSLRDAVARSETAMDALRYKVIEARRKTTPAPPESEPPHPPPESTP